MQTIVLSKGEKEFQQDMLNRGVRLDGRENMESRRYAIEMETLSLSPASCRVTWGHGYGNTTEVIVSVSTEVAKTKLSEPLISVKALKGSFGPSIDASEICQVIQSTIVHFLNNSGCLEPTQFEIANTPFSWKLFVDILIIRAAGAVYESAMIGIRETLGVLRFPQLKITPGETLAELHFDIDDSKESIEIIDKEKVPFAVSFAAGDGFLLLDPTPSEITVVQSLVVVGVSTTGSILGLNHFGERGMKSSAIAEISEHVNAGIYPLVV